MNFSLDINVNVKLDVTDRLLALLRLPQPVPVCPETQPQDTAPAPEPQPEPEKPKRARKPKAEPEPESEPQQPEPQQPEPESEPQDQDQEQQPEGPKELTEADVREAIDRTRRRFIGDDYAENTASEKRQRYYKPLSNQFKQISALLGAAKPSLLPDHNSRARFIAECDALTLDENGDITPPKPNF